MRKFAITVNGKTYEVEVQELDNGTNVPVTNTVHPAPAVTAPTSAPKQAEAPRQEQAPKVQQPKASSGPVPQGAEIVKSPMPGTILDVKVNVGDVVKKGDVLAILEAMKMENEIMAPRDAKVVSVQVSSGTSVNAGDPLVALE